MTLDDDRRTHEQDEAMSVIEPWLREILRCPRCHGQLRDDTGPGGGPELVCTADDCGLAYRLDDGIPVLLVGEARAPQHPTAQPDTQPDAPTGPQA